eukprot:gene1507-biopygen10132
MGIPEHIAQLIGNLYKNQEAQVTTEHRDTETFGIGKGVRQGCIPSPYLFNLYSEFIIRKANLDEMKEASESEEERLTTLDMQITSS